MRSQRTGRFPRFAANNRAKSDNGRRDSTPGPGTRARGPGTRVRGSCLFVGRCLFVVCLSLDKHPRASSQGPARAQAINLINSINETRPRPRAACGGLLTQLTLNAAHGPGYLSWQKGQLMVRVSVLINQGLRPRGERPWARITRAQTLATAHGPGGRSAAPGLS